MAKKTAKKQAAKKKAAKKPTAKRRASARKRLEPSRQRRGLAIEDVPLGLDAREVAALVDEVRAAGGAPIGAYREPLSGRALLVATLPRERVQPTPFQRDLSPTHTKRLAAKIEQSGSFLDPIIVVRGADGRLWTPNGRHRLAAAKVLGLQQITALVSPDEELAFQILALNTEKAHNLKDQSLEVIRMARELADRKPRSRETDYESEFDAPELLTLGIVYADQGRFAGGAYRPLLKKCDRFLPLTLPKALAKREAYAARLVEIDAEVARVVDALEAKGFKSPYLKTFVVARINPVRFHRAKRGDTKAPMELSAALTRMAASAKKFDTAKVKPGDLSLVAAVAPDAD